MNDDDDDVFFYLFKDNRRCGKEGRKKVNIKLGIKYVRQMAWKSRKQQEHITYEGT